MKLALPTDKPKRLKPDDLPRTRRFETPETLIRWDFPKSTWFRNRMAYVAMREAGVVR